MSNLFTYYAEGQTLSALSYEGTILGLRKSKYKVKTLDFIGENYKRPDSENMKVNLIKAIRNTKTLIDVTYSTEEATTNPFINDCFEAFKTLPELRHLSFNFSKFEEHLINVLSTHLSDLFLTKIRFTSIILYPKLTRKLSYALSKSTTLKSLIIFVSNFVTSKYSIFSQIILKTTTLCSLKLIQVTLSNKLFFTLVRLLKENETVKEIFFMQADYLTDTNLTLFSLSILNRNIKISFTGSLATYSDYGGYMLSKILKNNYLQQLHIRRTNITSLSFKILCASIVKQETLQNLTLRILYLIPIEDKSWQCFAMTINYVKLKANNKLVLTDTVPEEVNEALNRKIKQFGISVERKSN